MNVKCSYCCYEWTSSEKTIYECPNCSQMVICRYLARNKPHEILKDITEACGVRVLSGGTRMWGVLADVTQNKLIRKIILLAINDNIHGKLLNSPNNDVKIESLKYFFATQNFLYKETADYIVDSFAYALGITHNIDLSKLKEDWFTDNSDKKNFSMYEKVEPVAVLEFFVVDEKVIENQTFTIRYSTIHAKSAFINNEEVPITNNEFKTQVLGYKQYVLRVENEHFKDSKKIEVQPIKLPQIANFKATKTHIKSGEKVILSWNVTDAKLVTIKYDNKEIDVSNKFKLEVEPTNTIQYEIFAYTVNGLYSTPIKTEIIVVKPIRILFQANKERIFESDKILLEWQVANAKKVLLLPIQKDVTGSIKIELWPRQATTYTLQASNEVFREEKSVSVFVHPLPVIGKIFLPKLPTFDIPLPNLSFDTSYKQSIGKNIEKVAWYNKLFSLQFTAIYSHINRIYNISSKLILRIIHKI